MKKVLPANPRPVHFEHDNAAVSPVVGAILMILMTVLLAGITVNAVYGKDYSSSMEPAPMAAIEVESVVGGVPDRVQYPDNFIVLVHKSGDPLETRSTRIVITSEGSTYTGVVAHGGVKLYGNLCIGYEDLGYGGKVSQYYSRNPHLSDGLWSAGERLVLNGEDSIDGTAASSVLVSIDGMSNTSNNFGLREKSVLTVKVFDRDTNRIISQVRHEVTPAE